MNRCQKDGNKGGMKGDKEGMIFLKNILFIHNKEHDIVAFWQEDFATLVFLWITFASHVPLFFEGGIGNKMLLSL